MGNVGRAVPAFTLGRLGIHLDELREVATVVKRGGNGRFVRLEAVRTDPETHGAVAARSPSINRSVVAWSRRPRAKLRTSFVLRSMATKQYASPMLLLWASHGFLRASFGKKLLDSPVTLEYHWYWSDRPVLAPFQCQKRCKHFCTQIHESSTCYDIVNRDGV